MRSQINCRGNAHPAYPETLLPGSFPFSKTKLAKSLLRVLKINGRPRTPSSLLKSPPPLLILGPKPRLPVRRSGCPVILPGLWFYLARARRAAASTRLHAEKKYSSNRGPGGRSQKTFEAGVSSYLDHPLHRLWGGHAMGRVSEGARSGVRAIIRHRGRRRNRGVVGRGCGFPPPKPRRARAGRKARLLEQGTASCGRPTKRPASRERRSGAWWRKPAYYRGRGKVPLGGSDLVSPENVTSRGPGTLPVCTPRTPCLGQFLAPTVNPGRSRNTRPGWPHRAHTLRNVIQKKYRNHTQKIQSVWRLIQNAGKALGTEHELNLAHF